MKQFIEYVPITLFVIVYFTSRDVFLATMVLMAGVALQVAIEYAMTRKVGRMTQIIFWAAMILGGATLLFRNETFLQWKPTVVNWLFALGLLGGHFFTRESPLKKMLGEQVPLPDPVWRNLTLGWAFGFFVAGVLNLIVAYNFSMDFWVSYKLVGGFAITMVYMVATMIYLVKGGHLSEEALEQKQSTDPADIKQ